MSRPIIYVISEVTDSPNFVWIAKRAKAQDWNLVFVLMGNSNCILEQQLRSVGVEVISIPYRRSLDIFRAFFQLCLIFLARRPRAVHAHLLAANCAGLAAAWVTRIPNRIYTRHHSDWHASCGWHAKFYDYFANITSTRIVATCQNVKTYLTKAEGVKESKISLVHLGFELDSFAAVTEARVALIKKKYSYAQQAPVVGIISRYVKYKGVPYAIEAFRQLLREHPNACLVLANAGHGSDQEAIQRALAQLPTGSYREIAFESDGIALMKSFDVFVHVPTDEISEAFGQVYVEALLSQVPSVVTMSGVAPEILRNGENAIVVPYCNPQAILAGLSRILHEPELAAALAARGAEEARDQFPVARMAEQLRVLY